jgi:peroxiredoxin
MIKWFISYYIQKLYTMGIGKIICVNRNQKFFLQKWQTFPKGEKLNKRDVNFGLVAEILPLLLVYC